MSRSGFGGGSILSAAGRASLADRGSSIPSSSAANANIMTAQTQIEWNGSTGFETLSGSEAATAKVPHRFHSDLRTPPSLRAKTKTNINNVNNDLVGPPPITNRVSSTGKSYANSHMRGGSNSSSSGGVEYPDLSSLEMNSSPATSFGEGEDLFAQLESAGGIQVRRLCRVNTDVYAVPSLAQQAQAIQSARLAQPRAATSSSNTAVQPQTNNYIGGGGNQPAGVQRKEAQVRHVLRQPATARAASSDPYGSHPPSSNTPPNRSQPRTSAASAAPQRRRFSQMPARGSAAAAAIAATVEGNGAAGRAAAAAAGGGRKNRAMSHIVTNANSKPKLNPAAPIPFPPFQPDANSNAYDGDNHGSAISSTEIKECTTFLNAAYCSLLRSPNATSGQSSVASSSASTQVEINASPPVTAPSTAGSSVSSSVSSSSTRTPLPLTPAHVLSILGTCDSAFTAMMILHSYQRMGYCFWSLPSTADSSSLVSAALSQLVLPFSLQLSSLTHSLRSSFELRTHLAAFLNDRSPYGGAKLFEAGAEDILINMETIQFIMETVSSELKRKFANQPSQSQLAPGEASNHSSSSSSASNKKIWCGVEMEERVVTLIQHLASAQSGGSESFSSLNELIGAVVASMEREEREGVRDAMALGPLAQRQFEQQREYVRLQQQIQNAEGDRNMQQQQTEQGTDAADGLYHHQHHLSHYHTKYPSGRPSDGTSPTSASSSSGVDPSSASFQNLSHMSPSERLAHFERLRSMRRTQDLARGEDEGEGEGEGAGEGDNAEGNNRRKERPRSHSPMRRGTKAKGAGASYISPQQPKTSRQQGNNNNTDSTPVSVADRENRKSIPTFAYKIPAPTLYVTSRWGRPPSPDERDYDVYGFNSLGANANGLKSPRSIASTTPSKLQQRSTSSSRSTHANNLYTAAQHHHLHSSPHDGCLLCAEDPDGTSNTTAPGSGAVPVHAREALLLDQILAQQLRIKHLESALGNNGGGTPRKTKNTTPMKSSNRTPINSPPANNNDNNNVTITPTAIPTNLTPQPPSHPPSHPAQPLHPSPSEVASLSVERNELRNQEMQLQLLRVEMENLKLKLRLKKEKEANSKGGTPTMETRQLGMNQINPQQDSSLNASAEQAPLPAEQYQQESPSYSSDADRDSLYAYLTSPATTRIFPVPDQLYFSLDVLDQLIYIAGSSEGVIQLLQQFDADGMNFYTNEELFHAMNEATSYDVPEISQQQPPYEQHAANDTDAKQSADDHDTAHYTMHDNVDSVSHSAPSDAPASDDAASAPSPSSSAPTHHSALSMLSIASPEDKQFFLQNLRKMRVQQLGHTSQEEQQQLLAMALKRHQDNQHKNNQQQNNNNTGHDEQQQQQQQHTHTHPHPPPTVHAAPRVATVPLVVAAPAQLSPTPLAVSLAPSAAVAASTSSASWITSTCRDELFDYMSTTGTALFSVSVAFTDAALDAVLSTASSAKDAIHRCERIRETGRKVESVDGLVTLLQQHVK